MELPAREALTAYAAREQLHVTETREEEAIRGLVERWKADNGIQNPKDVLLLASLNAEVRAINRQCQEERLRAGELREEKPSVGGDDIHVHDRVLLTRRDWKLGVENGFLGEVVRIDQETATLRVRLDQDGSRSVALKSMSMRPRISGWATPAPCTNPRAARSSTVMS